MAGGKEARPIQQSVLGRADQELSFYMVGSYDKSGDRCEFRQKMPFPPV